jgi:hypothetical protein
MSGKVDERFYQAANKASLATKLMIRARDQIYADFMEKCRPALTDGLLDVGVSDVVNDAANLLERAYPHRQNITAVGLGSGEDFRAAFPEVAYRRIVAGEKLPFADRSFNFAVSNAVLEHVGDAERQKAFVTELFRVSKSVFLTVPNRFFPVEHHTAIPLLHWTDSSFRWACRLTEKDEWARTENLILMSRSRLLASAPDGADIAWGYTGLRLGPFSSNMFLHIRESNDART